MKQKTVILITGPTASGKTSLAIQLARQFQTDIISADSRQCYIEMNIGVAKPSATELSSIRHYFINSHSIHDQVNAATFAEYASSAADEIFTRNDIAIMAGGTGLYIKSFVEGLDEIPEVPFAIREDIIKQYEEKGLAWLQEEVKFKDPLFFSEGEIQNPQRLMRALEVKIGTGKSIKEFQGVNYLHRKGSGGFYKSGVGNVRNFNLLKYAIDIPRDQLYQNINQRIDKMMEQGLLEEVSSLLPFKKLNALQTVGYSELFDHLDGKHSLGEAIEKIKLNTRHYAKRQLTWFRKDPDIKWIKDIEGIESLS